MSTIAMQRASPTMISPVRYSGRSGSISHASVNISAGPINQFERERHRPASGGRRRRGRAAVAHLGQHRVHHQQQPDGDRERHRVDLHAVELVVEVGEGPPERDAERPSPARSRPAATGRASTGAPGRTSPRRVRRRSPSTHPCAASLGRPVHLVDRLQGTSTPGERPIEDDGSTSLAWGTMCGIIGVISRRPTRESPSHGEIIGLLDRAVAAIGDVPAATAAVSAADTLLKGLPGVIALVDRHELVLGITSRLDQLDAFVADFDLALEQSTLPDDELERRNAEAIALRDALWAVRHDRLRTAREVDRPGRPRSECRRARRLPRRPAGALGARPPRGPRSRLCRPPPLRARSRPRSGRPRGAGGARRACRGPDLSVGLGTHSPTACSRSCTRRRPRSASSATTPRPCAPRSPATISSAWRWRRPDARTAVLGHTRWASVGIISEPNAHPVNSDELESSPVSGPCPYVVAALNGDVDNHADLASRTSSGSADHITTDAKVIPGTRQPPRRRWVRSRRGVPAHGVGSSKARWRSARCRARGSRHHAARPLAAAGRVSTSDSPTTASSSPASRTASSRRPPSTSASTASGAVRSPCSMRRSPETLDGIRRLRYDGTRARRSTASDARRPPRSPRATSTSATHPHFLLKEITEAPASLRRRRCAARSPSATACCGRSSAGVRCRPPSPPGSPTGSITPRPRHRPGHRRRRRSERWRRCSKN